MENLSKSAIWSLAGIIAAVAVLIGSAGPWARVWFITVSGLDGDGKITAALALLCAGLLGYRAMRPAASRWIPIAATVGFVVCLAFGVYYLADLQSFISESQSEEDLIVLQVGWGLYVLVLGALSGVVASILTLRSDASTTAQDISAAPFVSEV